jgi:hypothetical protein
VIVKYRDLIQFEPVTEVIQLRWADQKEKASSLIATYVISDRMADVILHRILPALRFDDASIGRGLLIVGNYGTGKSHLMSVVTAAAEHADLNAEIGHPAVAEGLKVIAGKFKVVRQETGANTMHLRDVVLGQLEKQLKGIGVEYTFPPMSQAASNKDLLVEMMQVFKQRYPGMGLLVALDELLDFLRARSDKELVLDLNFLRELGEACELEPLRFIAGIQEALFDSSRFQFAADSIRRVKARFDQVSIVREDLAYVVSHRLLVKTQSQRRKVKHYLEKFTSLYTAMAERLDQYVELFPVHPAYLEIFEQVTIGERRDLLKALSLQMTSLMNREIPDDRPGLIAFDAYWRMLSEDRAYRTIPEVRAVQDKAKVLSERIRNSPGMKEYGEAALRIIDGLALQRLTLGDVYAPIGLTPTELRDQLLLHLLIPEKDADFLLATVESVLKEISRTVSGQFISHNPENDQYYLDLKKDIDFDALIDQRALTLEDSTLDRYYFEVMVRALELNESSYVPGFRIWQREIAWTKHGITRQGYIFLGASNERSTAHPERDFYLHFLAPFGNGNAKTDGKEDEVFFSLSVKDEDFSNAIRHYAGAREMSAISSGSNKDQYDRKAAQAQMVLTTWLRENLLRAFQIRYQSEEFTSSEAVSRYRLSLRNLPFRDQVYKLGSAIFDWHFNRQFPDYPCFEGMEFTSETARMAAESTLRAIAGGPVTRNVQTVLEGLKLAVFEGGKLNWTIEESPYAVHFMELLAALNEGQVLNRSEFLSGEPGAERDTRFKLEPEWVLVVLASLTRHGILNINLPGGQIADGDLDNSARMSIDHLWRFTSISRPKALPEAVLRELCTQMNVDPELINNPRTLESGVRQLQQQILSELDRVVRMMEDVRDGPRCWGEAIYSAKAQQDLRTELGEYRQFLNSLQNLNAPSKLRNLTCGIGEIRAAFRPRKRLEEVNSLFDLLRLLQPLLEYLSQVQIVFPASHPWVSEAAASKAEVLATLRDPIQRSTPGTAGLLKGRLENLQSTYIQAYMDLHQKMRLDRAMDDRKRQLTSDQRWSRMRALSKLELLPEKSLLIIQDRLGNIRTCSGLQPYELNRHVYCPHCSFTPGNDSGKQTAAELLEAIENDFEMLCSQWIEALLINLQTPEAEKNLPLLNDKERQAVRNFIQSGALPEKITDDFVNGLQSTLQGLEKLTIDSSELLLELTKAGMPCTPEELESRIREYLQSQFQSKDRRKLRIYIEW